MTTAIARKGATTLAPTADVLAAAHTLATTKVFMYDPKKFWVGLSGETVAGSEVARHLTAAANILARDGWVRRYSGGTEVDLSGDANTMSVTTMIRKAFQLLQEAFGFFGDKRLTLDGAMYEAIEEGAGDCDTNSVANHVLSTILRASRGETENSNWPIHGAWSQRASRTQDEVMALLAAGVAYARRYGPAA